MKRRSTIETVDAKIIAIRIKAGNPGTHCPTCTRPVREPFRRIIPGSSIYEGCIDASHGPHLAPTTNSYAWHMRPQAILTRRKELAWLKSL